MSGDLLSGRLPPVQLSSLLQMLETDEVSGWLELSAGRIGFREGKCVSAACGELTGRSAVLALLMQAEGAFRVTDDTPDSADALGDGVWMIMEAAQLKDEWARLKAQVLRPDGWQPDAPRLQTMRSFLDGERTLAEAILLADLPVVEAISAIEAALSAGTLKAARPPDPQRAQRANDLVVTGSFFELLDEGRSHLRKKRFMEAEACFAGALRLEPGNRIAKQNLQRARALQQRT